MKRFISEHESFTKLQNNVTKHINILSDMRDVIQKRNLMEVSQAEQELANPATNLSAAASYDEVMRLLKLLTVSDKDKVRSARK
jgi:vacuolar protein sorting-associated protein 45